MLLAISTITSPLPQDSDADRWSALKVFCIVVLLLTTFAIALRLWSRALGSPTHPKPVLRFWWDDWVALIALVFTYVAFGLFLGANHFGPHIWEVPPKDLAKIFKILYCVYFIFIFALLLTKTSALLLLSRLFPSRANSKWWNYALWMTHGLNVASFIGITLFIVFMCKPVQKGWNPTLPGRCTTLSDMWISTAVASVAIDLIILLLPLPKIWRLNLSRTRKAGVLLVFIMGYSVIVVSLGKMVTVFKSGEVLNKDLTHEGLPLCYWFIAEVPATIISICIPSMLNLARHFLASFLSPLLRKISLLANPRSNRKTMSKFPHGAFELRADQFGEESALQLQQDFSGSQRSFITSGKGLHSKERENELQYPASTYKQMDVANAGRDIPCMDQIRIDRDFAIVFEDTRALGPAQISSHMDLHHAAKS